MPIEALILAGTLAFAPPAADAEEAVRETPSSSLGAALQREARVLRQERDALQAAVDEVERSAKTSAKSLEVEIEGLTAQLAKLEAENASLERALPARERPRALADQERQLEQLINDMRSWLETNRIQTPEHSEDDRGDPARLAPLVRRVLVEVERRGRLRIESDASYFDADGKPRTAPVLRVGEVAAIAWDGPPAALIATPAGMIEAQGVDAKRQAHPSGHRVTGVLYQADALPDPHEFARATWRTRMEQGGALMWVLFAFAVVALGVAVERAFGLGRLGLAWRRVSRRFAAANDEAGRAEAAREAPTWLRRPFEIAGAALDGREVAEDELVQSLLPLRQMALARLPILGVIAAAAPLTGLLGTVTGMIATFTVVTQRGTSDPQALAGGISQALLTTQFGLAVAIPVLLIHVAFNRGARRLVGAAETTMLDVMHRARSPKTTPDVEVE